MHKIRDVLSYAASLHFNGRAFGIIKIFLAEQIDEIRGGLDYTPINLSGICSSIQAIGQIPALSRCGIPIHLHFRIGLPSVLAVSLSPVSPSCVRA